MSRARCPTCGNEVPEYPSVEVLRDDDSVAATFHINCVGDFIEHYAEVK